MENSGNCTPKGGAGAYTINKEVSAFSRWKNALSDLGLFTPISGRRALFAPPRADVPATGLPSTRLSRSTIDRSLSPVRKRSRGQLFPKEYEQENTMRAKR